MSNFFVSFPYLTTLILFSLFSDKTDVDHESKNYQSSNILFTQFLRSGRNFETNSRKFDETGVLSTSWKLLSSLSYACTPQHIGLLNT